MLASCLKQSVNPTRNIVLFKLSQPGTTGVLQCRAYAHSRFSNERGPGSSRPRERIERIHRERPVKLEEESSSQKNYGSSFGYEEKPSAEQSPLWYASQRPPASNPEEGLKRLLLENDTLIVTRQLEMLNIFVGFEQSNKYVITNELGDTLGYIAEEPRGILSTFSRQILRTHRPFRALVMDSYGSPVLWLRRPFAWINSRMFIQKLKDLHTYTPEGEPVLDTFAEVQQIWHIWRRKYDLFLRDTSHPILTTASEPQPEPESESFRQFSKIDEGLWAWHFTFRDARGDDFASVNRAFRGFGREIFTDTGQYAVRFSPQPIDPMDTTPRAPTIIRDLSLEERALILGMAVNIDFDYFSRHSEGGGWGLPMFFGGSSD